MKPRPDLTIDSSEVKSNPNDFYMDDDDGNINELEDDEERILFGTVDNPSRQCQEDPEDRLWKEAERDIARACDPNTNPHLMAINAIFGILNK